MHCDIKGCKNEARWQIGFRAYAVGYAKSERTKIESYLGLGVCEEHKLETKREDIITPENSALINNRLVSLHYVPLDMKNAEVIFHEIIDGKLYMPISTAGGI